MNPNAKRFALAEPKLAAAIRDVVQFLYKLSETDDPKYSETELAAFEAGGMLSGAFGKATDCSICRGWHGQEVEHACE